MINQIVWLCLVLTTPEGSLLEGHTPTYSAGILIHTTQVVSGGCEYYRVAMECEAVYDRRDDRFTTTYLCSDD